MSFGELRLLRKEFMAKQVFEKMAILTWTKLFAAQKSGFLFAVPIIPSPILCEIRKAVLTRVLPRLLDPIEFSPICEFPRTSVCPFPISL